MASKNASSAGNQQERLIKAMKVFAVVIAAWVLVEILMTLFIDPNISSSEFKFVVKLGLITVLLGLAFKLTESIRKSL